MLDLMFPLLSVFFFILTAASGYPQIFRSAVNLSGRKCFYLRCQGATSIFWNALGTPGIVEMSGITRFIPSQSASMLISGSIIFPGFRTNFRTFSNLPIYHFCIQLKFKCYTTICFLLSPIFSRYICVVLFVAFHLASYWLPAMYLV